MQNAFAGETEKPNPEPAANSAWDTDWNSDRIAVRRLSLTDFRSYSFARLETDPRPVVLSGPNGAGKTILLEALSYLVPGRGLRRASLAEVGRVNAGEANGRTGEGHSPRAWAVAARIERGGVEMDLGTGYLHNGGEGERARRMIKLDGTPAKNQAELGRQISALWLPPQMDRLFQEGPSARRRFIDQLIMGFDPDHSGPLNAYKQSLRNRNRLLRDGASNQAWFASVEQSLSTHGIAVAVRRRDAIARLAPIAASGHGPFPGAQIVLGGALEDWLAAGPALDAEDSMRAALAECRGGDAALGSTSIGPHRSDVLVRHSDTGLEAARCSSGEQKALLVSLVFAAARLQAEVRRHTPLLLLDEVAAHLDAARRDALFDLVAQMGAQTWMTGTDEAVFASFGNATQRFYIEDGKINPAP